MNEFGRAPIRMEGGVANPDEFAWECACEACQAKYEKWKEAFEIQQNQFKKLTPSENG
jgi:hypothetical protein